MFTKTATIALILALLAFSGCLEQPVPEQPNFMLGNEEGPLEFFPVDEPGTPLNPVPIAGNAGAMPPGYGMDEAFFNTAVEELDTQYCADISEIWIKNNCITSVAVETQDTSICSGVTVDPLFGEDSSNVINQCIGEVAVGALYTELCISSPTDQWGSACWAKAEQVCSQISIINWRESCIKNAAIDAVYKEKCLELHGFEHDICLEEVAVALPDLTLCDSIFDSDILESCVSRVNALEFFDLE